MQGRSSFGFSEHQPFDSAVGSIGSEQLGNVDVVRCFNVLGYYDDGFRTSALGWLEGILREGGLVFCGANVGRSAACRYFVYQKVDGRLLAREFAFGVEIAKAQFRGLPEDKHHLLGSFGDGQGPATVFGKRGLPLLLHRRPGGTDQR